MKDNRKIVNHKWQCDTCSSYIGEDYEECPICRISINNSNPVLKNKCACCQKEFKNKVKHYSKYGNYCISCIIMISKKMEWYNLRRKERLNQKEKIFFGYLTDTLNQKYHLDMEKEYKERIKFNRMICKIYSL